MILAIIEMVTSTRLSMLRNLFLSAIDDSYIAIQIFILFYFHTILLCTICLCLFYGKNMLTIL